MTNSPLVSIIVPTRNNAATLSACLESIHAQTYVNIELIVVDRDSTDQTKAIAKKFTPHVLNHGPERSAQRNFGAARAHGQFVLFIDSDMEVTPYVVAECIQMYERNPNLAAIDIPERSFGEGFWAKCKALERSYYVGVDWIEAPRFMTAAIFQQSGTWDEKLAGAEDYDLTQRLRRFGPFGHISAFINHNEGRITLSSLLRKRRKLYGQGFKRKGQSNHYLDLPRMVALFLSRPLTILRHPVLWSGMIFMRAFELLARLFGLSRAKKERAH